VTSFIQTHDGNVLLVDPEVGTISAPSREAAEAERHRRLAKLTPATPSFNLNQPVTLPLRVNAQ
jgi:hypothetical protein